MAATAAKDLPRFWVSICSYKKEPFRKLWDRILDLAWLKFAVAALRILDHELHFHPNPSWAGYTYSRGFMISTRLWDICNHKNKRFWTLISDIRIRGWTIRWAKKFPFFSHSWPCATRLIYYHRQWWKPFNLSPASPTKIKGLSKPVGPGGGEGALALPDFGS